MLKFIVKSWFAISRWKFVGILPHNLKKSVVVYAPFSSRLDFVFVLLNSTVKLKGHRLIADASRFSFPWNMLLKQAGAVNLDLSRAEDRATVENWLKENQKLHLAFMPADYTNGSIDWDLTFYRLAKDLSLPIVLVAFDYRRKWVKYHLPFGVSLDEERDIRFVKNFYSSVTPRFPVAQKSDEKKSG